MGIRNLSQTAGGVAQDILPAFHSNGGFILTALSSDGWINFGADAAPDTGERLYVDSPTKFSYAEFPELNARVSVYFPTTGDKFTFRPIG